MTGTTAHSILAFIHFIVATDVTFTGISEVTICDILEYGAWD